MAAAPGPQNVVADGKIVAFIQGRARRGDEAQAVVLNAESGVEIWRRADYPWLARTVRTVLASEQLVFEVSTLNDDDADNGIHVVDAATGERVDAALKQLEAQGATLVEVSLPNSHLTIPTYYVIAPAEASTNLSRFDGVRYGYRCADPADLHDLYTRTREEGFGDEVKRRILVGTYALSAGYYDAYYKKAQQVRRLIKQDFMACFEQADVLAGPTTPGPAFALGAKSDDPVSMYLEDVYTLAVNLAGLPGISVPAGLVEGKPVGLQLIGRHFDESRLLNVAHRFQQSTDWHLARPSGIEGEAA